MRAAKIVGEIDTAWIGLFQSFLEQSGMTPPESFVRARIACFHQVGYYALGISENLEARAQLAPYYYQALIGSPAPPGMEEGLRKLADRKPRRAAKKKAAELKEFTA